MPIHLSSWTLLTLPILLAGLAGCGDRPRVEEETPIYDTSSPLEEDTAGTGEGVIYPTAAAFAPELDVSLGEMTESPTGLFVRDVQVGTGETAEPGDTVIVHYTGWLPTGQQFDSSRDRGEPFSFPLGAGRVIPGWDEGVAGMKEGGRRKLVIPPRLGYGSEGAGDLIPAGATLVFDVELLEVR